MKEIRHLSLFDVWSSSCDPQTDVAARQHWVYGLVLKRSIRYTMHSVVQTDESIFSPVSDSYHGGESFLLSFFAAFRRRGPLLSLYEDVHEISGFAYMLFCSVRRFLDYWPLISAPPVFVTRTLERRLPKVANESALRQSQFITH